MSYQENNVDHFSFYWSEKASLSTNIYARNTALGKVNNLLCVLNGLSDRKPRGQVDKRRILKREVITKGLSPSAHLITFLELRGACDNGNCSEMSAQSMAPGSKELETSISCHFGSCKSLFWLSLEPLWSSR